MNSKIEMRRRMSAVQWHSPPSPDQYDARWCDSPPCVTICFMAGRECHHCKQWIADGETHDCWTTTEAALTQDLSDDLRDAWDRLREAAASFGDQRIYASHKSIMFSRQSCYLFVRPKRSSLELCIFLGRTLKGLELRRVERVSKPKLAHFIRITHRDEVEAPITDWLREAYEFSGESVVGIRAKRASKQEEGSP